MKQSFSILLSTLAAMATLAVLANAAPASEWMNHGPPGACPQQSVVQITDQVGSAFYNDHCINSICVGTKGLSYLNSTLFTGGCAQKDVYCAALYDSTKSDVIATDGAYTVFNPKGHLLCSLPPSVKSTFECANGASTLVNTVIHGLTTFNSFSNKDAIVSGYFKSWRDDKGCAKTTLEGESKNAQDIFYPACGKKAGEMVCVKSS